MNVLIAMDSFKGSLSSLEAGEAVRQGVLRACPEARVQVLPLADGGEGTVEALCRGMGGTVRSARVTGPLGEPVEARYGVLPDGVTAILEMASAAGLTLVPPELRDPLRATSYGVGELIREAIGQGCRRFLVGIGGSATNDGGAGMLQALGFGLLDAEGRPIPRGAAGLEALRSISDENVLPQLRCCRFRVACDVSNPLCGERGASAVFGPQKGADPAAIRRMDRALAAFAALVRARDPRADADAPGAGAAGGLGFAFLAFTDAALESGVKIVLEETRLTERVREADLVITGEGRLDGQTAMGKAPMGVAEAARRYGRPVIALAGSVAEDAGVCNERGIDAFFPILRQAVSLEEAMEPDRARRNLTDTAEQVLRLLSLGLRAGGR